MAKKLGIILVFLALASGAIAFTALNSDDNETANTGTTSQVSSPQASSAQTNATNTAENAETSGSFVDYSEDALANAEGQKVLFFHAPWCSQCRSIEAGIESDGVPTGFTIIKVDYDSNQDLRAKYGVKLQTTFVKLDENNEKIDDYVAYSEPTFEAVKREFL